MTKRDAVCVSLGAMLLAGAFAAAEAATVWWFENRYSLGMR